jgi:hypothetical protein
MLHRHRAVVHSRRRTECARRPMPEMHASPGPSAPMSDRAGKGGRQGSRRRSGGSARHDDPRVVWIGPSKHVSRGVRDCPTSARSFPELKRTP